MCAHKGPNDQPKAGFQSFSFSILHGLHGGIVELLLKTADQPDPALCALSACSYVACLCHREREFYL